MELCETWAKTPQPYRRESVGLFRVEGEEWKTAMAPKDGVSKRFMRDLYNYLHENGGLALNLSRGRAAAGCNAMRKLPGAKSRSTRAHLGP